MRGWILIVVALAACEKKPPPPKNEFEVFEREFVSEYETLAKAMRERGEDVPEKDVPKNYRAIYVGPPGVFVDRKLVATLPEITTKHAELVAAVDANAKLMPAAGYGGLQVTLDLGAQPASVAIEVLRVFADRSATFRSRRKDPEVPQMASHVLCFDPKLRNTQSKDPELVQLSVFLDTGRIWVGLSRVNEYQEIRDMASGERDLDKLKETLRQHKASAFFADRVDIELAASAGTAADVIGAFDVVCGAGFIDMAVLAPNQLSARPPL